MVEISFAFARSSLCLVLFFVGGQDGPAPRAVDGEACIVLVDEACTPVDIDMNLLVMSSMRTSLTTLSTTLNSLNIHARSWKSRVRAVT
jgi:hypothetical protein